MYKRIFYIGVIVVTLVGTPFLGLYFDHLKIILWQYLGFL